MIELKMRKIAAALVPLLMSLLIEGPVQAQEDHSIYYGSRAGMHVTTVSKSGIGTSKAVIKIKHTREDAKAYCVEYEQDNSKACVKRTLADVKVRDKVTANCKKGIWTDVFGDGYVFEGKSKSSDQMAEYVIRNMSTNEVLDGSMASGYVTVLSIFQELCPGFADNSEGMDAFLDGIEKCEFSSSYAAFFDSVVSKYPSASSDAGGKIDVDPNVKLALPNGIAAAFSDETSVNFGDYREISWKIEGTYKGFKLQSLSVYIGNETGVNSSKIVFDDLPSNLIATFANQVALKNKEFRAKEIAEDDMYPTLIFNVGEEISLTCDQST